MTFRLLSLVLLFFPAVTGVPFGAGCEYSDGRTYHISWAQIGADVHFRLTLFGLPAGISGWSGIAFGDSMHAGLDVIVVRLVNGQVQVTDEFVQGFRSPSVDAVQNVRTAGATVANGIVQVQFSRPIYATSAGDKTIAGCSMWKFPVGLNRISPQGYLSHHSQTPHSRYVCLQQCLMQNFFWQVQRRAVFG